MKSSLVLLFLFLTSYLFAQKPAGVVSGPMPGHIDMRTATIWVELKEGIAEAILLYWPKDKPKATAKRIVMKKDYTAFPNTYKWQLPQLEPATTYLYNVVMGKENAVIGAGEVTTQPLWQYRTDAPDFSFVTGSCAYFNDNYDRPGVPYGKDSSIFTTMATETNASFMLWLGDNWYTREVDYNSEWGLKYRASRDRSMPVLQPLLKAMPHYAIWDDHDYGPNNADKSYILKDTSRSIFMKYWANPSYGQNGQGIFTKFTFSDVDFFLLDDRWFRSNDEMVDSIGGLENTAKRMFGEQQMEWLKNALLQSNSNSMVHFRVIATGSQVLNQSSVKDCFIHYRTEFRELMDFLQQHPINGLVFLTGDRHLSSVVKRERNGNYPLYDITASSLTAGLSRRSPAEASDPNMLLRVDDQNNYSRISFTGKGAERIMKVVFLNKKGEQLAEWAVALKDISTPKPAR
ncbi:alkaline phosphatase D family protein [Aridibaculum aurantiacum]|uniref:alkaline phosphatase D family protein n=1 Tax=Aridibaculum aurantiacum TaxID=2810307 RepID=UPI001A96D47E|nr:alkaline phosphatase D family protein [Aridibaculum aurantiacum]